MDLKLKVSIVTVTYNEAKMLHYALDSVKEQTYRHIEHIVVDGNSTDKTKKIVSRYRRIKFYSREPLGVYDALNYGLKQCTGDIVGFVHGSDALASDTVISKVVKAFEADPELDFVYGDLQYVEPVTRRRGRIYHADRFEPHQLIGGMAPPHPTLYMRRRTAEYIGEYSTDYPIAGDFDMWIRLFKDKSLKYKYIPELIAKMTTGGLSTRWRARLFYNNIEKLRVLHHNGLPANPIRLGMKYLYVIRDAISDIFNG